MRGHRRKDCSRSLALLVCRPAGSLCKPGGRYPPLSRRRLIKPAALAATALALLAISACSSGSARENEVGGSEAQLGTAGAQAAKLRPSPVATSVPMRLETFLLVGKQSLTQGGSVRGQAPTGAVSVTLDGNRVSLAKDGSFFVAFDRDARGSATLAATLADGSRMTHRLIIAPRAWKVEHVNVARRSGGPTEAFMRLRRPELAQINAARAKNTGTQGWRQNFVWPVVGRISGRFGSQRVYRGEPGSYHSGIDVTTGKSGTPFVVRT